MQGDQRIQQERVTGSLLRFTVHPYLCCLPAIQVCGLIRPPSMSRLPFSDADVAGVFRYQGVLATCYDLRSKFSLSPRLNKQSGIIMLGWNDDALVAFWVDEVATIIDSDRCDWQPLPLLLGQSRRLFNRCYLDAEQVILETSIAQLAQPGRLASNAALDSGDSEPVSDEQQWVESTVEQMPGKVGATLTSATTDNPIDTAVSPQYGRAEEPLASEPVADVRAESLDRCESMSTDNDDCADVPKTLSAEQSDKTKTTIPIAPVAGVAVLNTDMPCQANIHKKYEANDSSQEVASVYHQPGVNIGGGLRSTDNVVSDSEDFTRKAIVPSADRVVENNVERVAEATIPIRHTAESHRGTWLFGVSVMSVVALLVVSIAIPMRESVVINSRESVRTVDVGRLPGLGQLSQVQEEIIPDVEPVRQEVLRIEDAGLVVRIERYVDNTAPSGGNIPVQSPIAVVGAKFDTESGSGSNSGANSGVGSGAAHQFRYNNQSDNQSDIQSDIQSDNRKKSGHVAVIESADSRRDTIGDKNSSENNKATSQLTVDDIPVHLLGVQSTVQINHHIVVQGDTLWAIAQHYLGNPYRYPQLAQLSRITDPDLIYPGDRVTIEVIK